VAVVVARGVAVVGWQWRESVGEVIASILSGGNVKNEALLSEYGFRVFFFCLKQIY
jgi:hypothetical protein